MASVVRTSILGTMPGGEVWSVNPCFFLLDEPAEVTSSEAIAIANAIKAIAVPTGIRTMWSTSTALTGVRVEARDRNGVLESQAEASLAVAATGTGASPHPYQTSSVTSLRTNFPGGQGRGRLYWPATSALLVTATLRHDPSQVTSVLSGVKTYLSAIQAAVAASAGPCALTVWSRTGTAFHQVTELRQGDVLDVQRRRRDQLAETVSVLPYP